MFLDSYFTYGTVKGASHKNLEAQYELIHEFSRDAGKTL